ncbi:hypothetical protein BBP40_002303 [Aspergillus hancockii]|nr:hypothetical protein BBP40_002303 [Aspergillus hancockii]
MMSLGAVSGDLNGDLLDEDITGSLPTDGALPTTQQHAQNVGATVTDLAGSQIPGGFPGDEATAVDEEHDSLPQLSFLSLIKEWVRTVFPTTLDSLESTLQWFICWLFPPPRQAAVFEAALQRPMVSFFLILANEGSNNDNEFLRACEREGFHVTFVVYNYDEVQYVHELNGVKQALGVSESYAVIGFGDAAAFCLEHYLKVTNTSKLCALIAYYPTRIPDPKSHYTSSMHVLVHLAEQTVDVLPAPHSSDHKRRITQGRVSAGMGTGDRLDLGYPAYSYPGISPGFAESDLEDYDQIASQIAWSRSLSVLQSAFRKKLDLEWTWDNIEEKKYFSSDSAMVNYVITEGVPSVTYTPTLQGASGIDALRRFYETSFLRCRYLLE